MSTGTCHRYNRETEGGGGGRSFQVRGVKLWNMRIPALDVCTIGSFKSALKKLSFSLAILRLLCIMFLT